MSADLHIHTTFSDGTATPEEVIGLAKKADLKTIAITDHDVVDGIEIAISFGRDAGIEVIPGVEFTTENGSTEIHILGYFIDYRDRSFLEILKKIQQNRVSRIYKIVEKLKGLGVNVSAEDILGLSSHGSVGRPHVARILIKAGYVKSFREAFDKYLNFGGPAYVSHYKLSPEEAIKLILKVGGIPVYAHPAVSRSDELIPDLLAAGLMGIEVYYTGHSDMEEKHYLGLAKKYNLLVTGGSDFHGLHTGREVELGALVLADKYVDELRKAASKIQRKA